MSNEMIFSDESDDEILDHMDDETFEKLIEEAKARNFATEEEAKEYFDKKLKEEWSKLRRKKPKAEKPHPKENDPYYQIMKQDPEIQSRYYDHFDIGDKEYFQYQEHLQKNIARYPIGFRHLENFESYRTVHPLANVVTYHEDSKLKHFIDNFYLQ